MRWARVLAGFVYQFVVGDTPELALGVALIVVGGWALARVSGVGAVWFLPAAVVALLGVSLWRGAART